MAPYVMASGCPCPVSVDVPPQPYVCDCDWSALLVSTRGRLRRETSAPPIMPMAMAVTIRQPIDSPPRIAPPAMPAVKNDRPTERIMPNILPSTYGTITTQSPSAGTASGSQSMPLIEYCHRPGSQKYELSGMPSRHTTFCISRFVTSKGLRTMTSCIMPCLLYIDRSQQCAVDSAPTARCRPPHTPSSAGISRRRDRQRHGPLRVP